MFILGVEFLGAMVWSVTAPCNFIFAAFICLWERKQKQSWWMELATDLTTVSVPCAGHWDLRRLTRVAALHAPCMRWLPVLAFVSMCSHCRGCLGKGWSSLSSVLNISSSLISLGFAYCSCLSLKIILLLRASVWVSWHSLTEVLTQWFKS